jgi:hypothetical protein
VLTIRAGEKFVCLNVPAGFKMGLLPVYRLLNRRTAFVQVIAYGVQFNHHDLLRLRSRAVGR